MPTEDENRALWLTPYLTVQKRYETRIRTVLVSAAQEAAQQISALESQSTFSAGVRNAQLRLVLAEVTPVLKDIFNETITIVGNGQKDAAVVAANGLTKTDGDYLKAAFKDSGDYNDFVAGQKRSAQLGIVNAISSITKSDYDLSSNVYGTRALANRWVKNQVTSLILRGESAQSIAKAVRSSILPTTPGGVAYAALRLGRTELNNAFHATSLSLSEDRPWIEGMDWHLSSVHAHDPGRVEICETYTKTKWDLGKVPAKPHPQCRCYITPRLIAKAEFNRRLTAGQYESWISDAA